MRRRAFRPEVPGCLEGRSLLSGVAGPSADPVVLTRRRFGQVVQQVNKDFDLFARYRDLSQIRDEIGEVIVLIPFAGVDGLNASIDRILERMKTDIFAHVPNAFRSAHSDVLTLIRADVQARVQAGDVVVR